MDDESAARAVSGYLGPQALVGTPQPFFEALQHAPPDAAGSRYDADITALDVTGAIASVTLEERGFLGASYIDYFHLMKIDACWLIVSKTFTTR